jgi:thiamine phosphate synthase YjbQ (UPF0047 family)
VSGADTYTSTNGAVTIAPGQSSKNITITSTLDNTAESSETIEIVILSNSNYSITGTGAAALTITNNRNNVITLSVSPSTVSEGTGTSNTATYTFTRTGEIGDALSVYFSVGGTATLNTDYTVSGATSYSTSNGVVTIASGQSSASLVVATNPDTTSEQNETIVLTLASNSNYTVGTTSGVTLTITNDDVPTVTLSLSPNSINEGNTSGNAATYTFTRSGSTTGNLAINFSVGGTATFGTDYSVSGATSYSTSNGVVTIASGQSSASLVITTNSDTTSEQNETIVLTLASNSNYAVGTTSGVTLTITNDDVPTVTLSLSPNSINEGNTSGNAATYTFTRSGSTSNSLIVYFTVGGTASLTTDYTQSGASSFTSTAGSINILSGQSSAAITINTVADATIESDETVTLTLSNNSNYTVGTTSGVTLTITNDDFIPAISLSLSPTSIAEGNTTGNSAVYTFTRSISTASPLTVYFSVAGTATLTTDYTQSGANTFTSTTGSVVIPANQSSAAITINTVADTTIESDETVTLTLTSDSNYSITTTSGVTLTITDDDTPSISLSLSPTSITEGNTTGNSAVYTFTRSISTASPLTVYFSVAGTATLTTDYTQSGANTFTSTTGSVIIPANQSSAAITINTVADTTSESDETVTLTLTSDSNYSITTTSGVTLTITNDDTGVNLTFASLTDSNDLFYYLGTNSNTQAWTNPATAGMISLLQNPFDAGSDPISTLVDRANSSSGFYTTNTANAWVAVDIGSSRTFALVGYVFQNRNNSDAQALRSWKIQGTNSVSAWTVSGVNAATWTDLDTRTNNTTLSNSAAAAAYFSLSSQSSPYRYFRLLQTGLNAGSLNYLVLGEIKIYGTLYV